MSTTISLFDLENGQNNQTETTESPHQIDKSELEQLILSLSTCPLKNSGVRPVMPVGDGSSKIMLIGEAPGAKEDELGEPFVGASGKMLNNTLLPSVGLSRKTIHLTNIVKCRPPENRDPTEEEKAAWSPVLFKEIELVKPNLIVCLGRHSLSFFILNPRIGQIHGQVQKVSVGNLGQFNLMPLYHPAVALYNGSMLSVLKEDFLKIKEFVQA